jgi:putative sigma-54 modulation protein
MRIHYTGKLDPLDGPSQKKLDARFARLGKLLDGKSEKEAHVILTSQRHLTKAEITVNFYDHPLAGAHAATDNLSALMGACDRLEKQLGRLHDKRIDKKRRAGKTAAPAPAEKTPAAAAAKLAAKVYKIPSKASRKPMTVEEAVLEVTSKQSYIVYRDADSERLSVLIRRPDGHFDLVVAES